MPGDEITVMVVLDLAQRFDRDMLGGFLTVANAACWQVRATDWNAFTETQRRAAAGWLFRSVEDPLLQEPGIRARSVLVSGEQLPGVDRVWCDDRALGALAAEALAEQGYRQVAFRGDRRFAAFRARSEGFRDRARELGLRVHRLGFDELIDRWSWGAERDLALRRLAQLPRPIGLGLVDTLTAMRMAEHCREGGWRIGSEIGLIATDHDELAARACLPALAGIDAAAERIGIRAGELLQRRLRGLHQQPQTVLVPPAGLVYGGSIALGGDSDPILERALALIRERVDQGLAVEELAERLGSTRRSLERAFRAHLGRGPAAEIRRERVARAAALLRGSDDSLETIATTCGFGSLSAFSRAFKAELGSPPAHWRRR